MGSSASAIPYSLYQEITGEISPCELEEIDVTIYLANRETISPIGIVRDVEVLCGKVKCPTDFLILGLVQDDSCPVIFGRPVRGMIHRPGRVNKKASMTKTKRESAYGSAHRKKG